MGFKKELGNFKLSSQIAVGRKREAEEQWTGVIAEVSADLLMVVVLVMMDLEAMVDAVWEEEEGKRR